MARVLGPLHPPTHVGDMELLPLTWLHLCGGGSIRWSDGVGRKVVLSPQPHSTPFVQPRGPVTTLWPTVRPRCLPRPAQPRKAWDNWFELTLLFCKCESYKAFYHE